MNNEEKNRSSFVDKGKKIVKENMIPGFKAGLKQKAVAFTGAGLGTALSMKRGGKGLGAAIKKGGIAGMAAGDTLGSIAVPQYDLYKKHKKEFGKAPDAKSVGKVFAANTLPTAASWGAILGSKQGRKLYGEGLASPAMNIKSGVSETRRRLKDVNLAAKHGIIKPERVSEHVKDAFKQGRKKMKESGKEAGKAAGKMFIVDKVVDKAVEAPTYVVTPDSLIAKKKKKQEQEKMKTAFTKVQYEFEKIAKELSKKETKQILKENKHDLDKVRFNSIAPGQMKQELKEVFEDEGHALKSGLKGGAAGALYGGLVGAAAGYTPMAKFKHPYGRDVTRQMALKLGRKTGTKVGLLGALGGLTKAKTERANERKAQRFEKALDKKFGRENTVRVQGHRKKDLNKAYAQSFANHRERNN